jgi:hypothetical protein
MESLESSVPGGASRSIVDASRAARSFGVGVSTLPTSRPPRSDPSGIDTTSTCVASPTSSSSTSRSITRKKSQASTANDSTFDVVPEAYLLPPDHPIRGSSRTDAGVVVDRELMKLAGMDARCRLVQARLTRRLMEIRAWRPCGFVRLSDYARERLGCSPRILEEDARVLKLLDGLPRLRGALEAGVLSWTQARLLVRIATAGNESELLEKTAGLPTRELEALVRSQAAAGPNDSETVFAKSTDVGASGSTAPGEDDEPRVRWSVPLSPRGQRMWRAAGEIACRVAGSPLSPSQVLELVVAECSGGQPAGSMDDSRWTASIDEHEATFRRRLCEDQSRRCGFLEGFLAEMGVVEGFAWLDPARREAGPAQALDGLTRNLENTDARELDRRLREVRRIAQRIHYQLATLIRIGIDRRLFREIGFATVKLYVESRLGISARRIWSLVAIERMSWRFCKELREAWREGRISHLAACTLLPVIGGEHGDAWIRRAGEVTLRRLADEVAWALDSGTRSSFSSAPLPPPADAVVPVGGAPSVDLHEVQMRAHGEDPPDRWCCPGTARIAVTVPLSVAALLEVQLDRYRQGREQRWRTFERLVALAILEWTSGPRHRDPVFERDGWRCSVPACSSRRNLHDHHVVFRSKGGGNERGNRITACVSHHLHGIHEGIVTAEGKAPHGINWALGCRRGEEPLMRLRGDRYADAA